jgi:peptide/nickel transport system ATP-binding protein
MSEPLLEVEDLRVWFPIRRGLLRRVIGHVRAVDGVSFSLERGRTLALVGESGCGKTTVGRALLRLVEPSGGNVRFAGQDLLSLEPAALRPLRRRIQMVFQDPMTSLDPRMRVEAIVGEGLEAFGIGDGRSEREDRVRETLRRVGLGSDALRRFPHEFSGGQRQRIGIARALAVGPDLLICDEAVSALDVSIQAQILNLLTDLQAELGVAYLFITHDLSVVRHLASEVAVMYLGQLVERGPRAELLDAPQHPYTRGLLASVPSPDPSVPPLRAEVLGDVPSLAALPDGCRFHTRCPARLARCPVDPPPEHPSGSSRVRCHLYDPTAAMVERGR